MIRKMERRHIPAITGQRFLQILGSTPYNMMPDASADILETDGHELIEGEVYEEPAPWRMHTP